MPQTLIAFVVASSWIETPGWQSSTSKRASSAFLVPNEENLAQLFRNVKSCEKVKYNTKFGKFTLQSYEFKIYLRRTETSAIDNKLQKL